MKLTRWIQDDLPSLDALRHELGNQGYRVSEWTDAPSTVYPVHQHEETEVRWVVRGQLRVGLPEHGEEIILQPGDRLDLDPHETYWADVDAGQPVMYLIGIKNGHKK
jgi:quercetin dioxygenase-like cupin family protein